MNRAFQALDGLTTVIETDKSGLQKYVVASDFSQYEVSSSDDNDDDDGQDERTPKRRKPSREELTGVWTVTVGTIGGWWSGHFEKAALLDDLTRLDAPPTTNVEEKWEKLATKLRTAIEQRSVMIGLKKSVADHAAQAASIKLYLDLDEDPVELKLQRLNDETALKRATRIVLRANVSANGEEEAAALLQRDQLQRKLEATQQALREERHKYRALLAAPSAQSARTGIRPVVGLRPSFGSASQSSPPSQHWSSPSSSSGAKRRGEWPSSSSGALGPSSDDGSSQSSVKKRSSQKSLSLVNPTRVQRADPSENDEFVGDDD